MAVQERVVAGRYELLGELDYGSLGRVLRAHDGRLGRWRAGGAEEMRADVGHLQSLLRELVGGGAPAALAAVVEGEYADATALRGGLAEAAADLESADADTTVVIAQTERIAAGAA